MTFNISDFRIDPGSKVELDKFETKNVDESIKKDLVKEELKEIHDNMFDLQNRLYAEDKRGLLIILQATDAGGKDGTIRDVMHGFNPLGCKVVSFKVPNSTEAKHDFLWRVHHSVPMHGEIVIFNRSHYGDILAVSVHNLLPKKRWSKRYDHINDFERMLTDEGIAVLKFYLHISKDEQKKRLNKRISNPKKRWKFSQSDYEERKKWDENIDAYEKVLERCSTKWAPWYVVPADTKWYRNWVVGNIITSTLQEMDPEIPEMSEPMSEFLD